MTEKLDKIVANRFFEKAMRVKHRSGEDHDGQEKLQQAVVDEINNEREVPIGLRQIKYFNNIVEQGRRFIKRSLTAVQI